METTTIPLISRIVLLLPRIVQWGSFAIGTCLLGAFLATKEMNLIDYGFMFVSGALLLNLICVIILVGYAIVDSDYGDEIRRRTLHMLWNIPIALIYLFIVIANLDL